MIETALFKVLSTSAPITALCGTRIYPDVMDKNSQLPAIVYNVVTGVNAPNMSTRGKMRSRVQIDCYGDSAIKAAEVRDAVITTLSNYQDANFQSQILTTLSFFDEEALQYIRTVEIYAWYSL